MRVDVATYAGFKAYVNAIDDGIEVTYHDAEGREINREMFAGVKDYRLKQEHIDAQLKKYWEHRIDSN
jgi:predicted secreted protein